MWRKNRKMKDGELEFHLSGWRDSGWNPDVLDHPAMEMERRREENLRG